jgi:pyruvate/2-oxoacid:ferredoxin oxidoreductase beta subunit
VLTPGAPQVQAKFVSPLGRGSVSKLNCSEDKQMSKAIFTKTKMLTDAPTHYCPGCAHGIIHRLIAESIEELGLSHKTVGVAPVVCAVFAYRYFNCDMLLA